VLVTDDLTLKISDFGLVRDVQEDGSFANDLTKILFPFKWMAPEYLTYNAFGAKSDV
jgi:serine/threonine protein kinase